MKKLLTYILVTILMTASLATTSQTANAATGAPCDKDGNCGSGEICTLLYGAQQKKCEAASSVLLPRPGTTNTKYKELKAVSDLPELTDRAFFTSAIKTILGLSMVITLIAIIIAAIYYIYAQGQEENLTKGKDIILYLIIGLAVMAGAYGIISGIAQFEFFSTP